MSYGDDCDYCDHPHDAHKTDDETDGPCRAEDCDCTDYWYSDDEDDPEDDEDHADDPDDDTE